MPIDGNEYSDLYWFREIERHTNQLAFDILLSQEKMDEAFNYRDYWSRLH